jgi:hypothetical protein
VKKSRSKTAINKKKTKKKDEEEEIENSQS